LFDLDAVQYRKSASIYQVIEFHKNWHIESHTYVHKWISIDTFHIYCPVWIKYCTRCLHLTLLNICEFLWTWTMEGHTFATRVSEIALRSLLLPVAYPGILFWGVQLTQLRTEDRENGELGVVAPLSGVLEATVIWYKKFNFI